MISISFNMFGTIFSDPMLSSYFDLLFVHFAKFSSPLLEPLFSPSNITSDDRQTKWTWGIEWVDEKRKLCMQGFQNLINQNRRDKNKWLVTRETRIWQKENTESNTIPVQTSALRSSKFERRIRCLNSYFPPFPSGTFKPSLERTPRACVYMRVDTLMLSA